MSNKNQTLAEAYDIDLNKAASFIENIAMQAFAEELINQGIPVENDEQLAKLANMAQMFDNLVESNDKTASFIDAAYNKLASQVAPSNSQLAQEQQARADYDMAKAAELALHPEVAASVLALCEQAQLQASEDN
jgi:hypothetical protein